MKQSLPTQEKFLKRHLLQQKKSLQKCEVPHMSLVCAYKVQWENNIAYKSFHYNFTLEKMVFKLSLLWGAALQWNSSLGIREWETKRYACLQ